MQFTGPQLAELREALKLAFPSTADFGMMLMDRLNINIEDHAPPQKRDLVFFHTLQSLNADERIEDVYKAARSTTPNNSALKKAGEKLGLSTPVAEAALEKIVRPRVPLLDINVWRLRLGAIEQRVGRVVLGKGPAAQQLGSGFLVGPSVFITNHHVVRRAIAGTEDPKQLHVQFDYFVSPDGSVAPGVFVPLHQDWLIHAAPSSPLDEKVHDITEEPAEGELDFALLRLARPFGSEPFGSPSAGGTAEPRGWLDLTAAGPRASKGDPLFIVQHPRHQPMKLAYDDESVIGYSPNLRRLRYKTNTDNGSSGSPALNHVLDLIALHHSGDPNKRAAPEYNEGIPIETIIAHLGSLELLDMLSE